MEIIAGNGVATYEITVQSTSDVSCNYSIRLSNIPNNVQVSLDGGTLRTPVNREITFSNVGNFYILNGITSRTHEITFQTALGSDALTNNNVSVDVIFTQID